MLAINEYPDYVMREFKLVDTRVSNKLDYITLLFILILSVLVVIKVKLEHCMWLVQHTIKNPCHKAMNIHYKVMNFITSLQGRHVFDINLFNSHVRTCKKHSWSPSVTLLS